MAQRTEVTAFNLRLKDNSNKKQPKKQHATVGTSGYKYINKFCWSRSQGKIPPYENQDIFFHQRWCINAKSGHNKPNTFLKMLENIHDVQVRPYWVSKL